MADHLRALHYFCTTIEENGISAAAKKLQINKSLVSKQIKWLEDQFQSSLLERTTRQIRPTHTGHKLFLQAKNLLKDWDCIKNNMQNAQEDLAGNIRIGTTHWFGSHILNRHIIDYLGQNEHVTINLDLIGRQMDLVRDRLDICITTEPHILKQANMQKIALGTYSSRLVASKQYIFQHGEPKTFEDLKNHVFITGKEDSMSPATLKFGDKEIFIIPKLSVNRMDCVMQGVRAGLGIATALNTDPSLNDDDLITILEEYTPDEKVLYLTYLDKNYISYLLEDCIDYLVEKLKIL